jgi:tetratricopeptide (TPR) repeat protein
MKIITRALLVGLVALATPLPSLAGTDAEPAPGSYEEMVARSAEKFSDGKLGFTCTDVDVSLLLGDERQPQLERLLVQLAMDPGAQANHVAVGNYYARRSLWAHAAAAYGCANGLDDSNPKVWNNLAIVYLGQANPSGAITALRKAIRLDGEYGLAYYHNPQAASNNHQVELFLRRLDKNPIALATSLDD